jgi:ketosteroid isomerase-like protein
MTTINRHHELRVAQEFITAFEERDPLGVLATLHPQARLTIRLHIDGSPRPWYVFDGPQHIRGYIESVAAKFDRVAFRDQMWTMSATGDVVFLETHGDIQSSAEKLDYRNVYVFKFEMEDGKVKDVVEYANPVTYANLGIQDSAAEALAH